MNNIIERYMSDEEKEQHFQNMLRQIQAYEPDEIIAIARSGCALAQWVCEELNIKNLGFFEPRTKQFVHQAHSKKFVFVDDNCVTGQTYREVTEWFNRTQQGNMRFAVFFTDKFKTPDDVRQAVIQGVELDYYALGPIFSTREQPKPYVRTRDEL